MNSAISALTVESGKTLYIGDGSGEYSLWIEESFSNSGTIIIQANSYLFMQSGSTATNNGTITINGGITNGGNFTNNGVIYNNSSN